VAQLGIFGDFAGPYFPGGNAPFGGVIRPEEYAEEVRVFPRDGFTEDLVNVLCGLYRDKWETTFDNWVVDFGLRFGLDGKERSKDEFQAQCESKGKTIEALMGLMAKCDKLERRN
jgi:hypothetical protein